MCSVRVPSRSRVQSGAVFTWMVARSSLPDPLPDPVSGLTLRAVEEAIRQSWSVETCDPTDVSVWSAANPARGQCAVTSLVLNDLVGGQLLEAEVRLPDGSRQGFHYWNRLAGFDLDLTLEQFADDETVQAPRLIDRFAGGPWLAYQQYHVFRARVYGALGLEVPVPTEEPVASMPAAAVSE